MCQKRPARSVGVQMSIPVTGRCDEVEQDVNAVIAESGVTLDTGLFGKNIVVLTLEVADDLAKAGNVCQLGPLFHRRRGLSTLIHCRPGHRIQECRQRSTRYGYPPHRVRALQMTVSIIVVAATEILISYQR